MIRTLKTYKLNRLFIVSALALFIEFEAYTQTIHLLTFANTSDNTIGTMANDGNNIIVEELDRISRALGYNLSHKEFVGSRFTQSNFKNEIANFSSESSDIIFLYVITHGTRPYNDNSNFPHVLLESKSNYSSDYLQIESVHDYLKKKQSARLIITMVEACNAPSGINKRSYVASFAEEDCETCLTQNEKEVYRKLLKSTSGDIIMASSEPGRLTLGITGSTKGGLFTHNFILQLRETVKESSASSVTWKRLFIDTKIAVYDQSYKMTNQSSSDNKPHTPIFTANLTGGGGSYKSYKGYSHKKIENGETTYYSYDYQGASLDNSDKSPTFSSSIASNTTSSRSSSSSSSSTVPKNTGNISFSLGYLYNWSSNISLKNIDSNSDRLTVRTKDFSKIMKVGLATRIESTKW